MNSLELTMNDRPVPIRPAMETPLSFIGMLLSLAAKEDLQSRAASPSQADYLMTSLTVALIDAGKATMIILLTASTLFAPQGHF